MNFWRDKRVFITGHTGFKGSWLAFCLHSLEANVCGFALHPDDSQRLFRDLKLESKIKSITGDIRDLPLLTRKISDFEPEIVFHMAAQSLVRYSYREPIETYSTNLMGTVNVLEAVRKSQSVKSTVVITTDKVYENCESSTGYRETDRLGGSDPYSSSKACAELAVSAYRKSFFVGSEKLIATARAGNVIGGGDWSEERLLPDVFRSLIFRIPLVIRNPNSIRPWQHVLEPLTGYMLLAEKLYNGEKEYADAWNFGPSSGDAKPVSWMIEKLREKWGADFHWKCENAPQPPETKTLKLDSRRARTSLGWTPRLNIENALELTADWYKAFSEKQNLERITMRQIENYDLLKTIPTQTVSAGKRSMLFR